MPALAETGIEVTMNQAKIIKLSRAADTIIIGNPEIADASVQDASTVVLTGKGFGVTNLVILDDTGAPIIDEQVIGEPLDRLDAAHIQARFGADAFLHALLRKLLQDRRRTPVRRGHEQRVARHAPFQTYKGRALACLSLLQNARSINAG